MKRCLLKLNFISKKRNTNFAKFFFDKKFLFNFFNNNFLFNNSCLDKKLRFLLILYIKLLVVNYNKQLKKKIQVLFLTNYNKKIIENFVNIVFIYN